jgi:hypothetical protein
MKLAEVGKWTGSVVALVISYAAAFWLIELPHSGWSVVDRLGSISSAMCAVGVGVYFWVVILAPLAKNRYWSAKQCQLMSLLTLIPGAIFLVFTSSFPRGVDLLFFQSLFVGFLLVARVHPDYRSKGPFERDPPVELLGK